jgi:hypothetical protein
VGVKVEQLGHHAPEIARDAGDDDARPVHQKTAFRSLRPCSIIV